jgi:MFS superfamily sulfate permease-like transporter
MGVSGAVSWLAALTSRPVVRGIVLGLGLGFILDGVTFMHRAPLVAVPAVVLTFLLPSHPRLGAVLVVGALFFADSVGTLFRLLPLPVLGVILFFGGIELAVGLDADTFSRGERTVLVVTARIALWNMGLAHLAGLLLHRAMRRGIVRF